MTSYELGQAGEQLATERLCQEGMQIIETRWKDHAYEIDIVAFDPSTDEIVFVEVKTRQSGRWGRPEDAVDYRKIMRSVRAADFYLRSRNIDYQARFDVFAIELPASGSPHVEYYKNAYYPPLG